MHVVLETLQGKGISEEHEKHNKEENVFPLKDALSKSDDDSSTLSASSNASDVESVNSKCKTRNTTKLLKTGTYVASSAEFMGTEKLINKKIII